jgi:hypothetical protein
MTFIRAIVIMLISMIAYLITILMHSDIKYKTKAVE